MREIKFRAKTKKSGSWVHGFYVNANGVAMIMDEIELSNADCFIGTVEFTFYRIIPETVGQFTGLLDKHGRKIFEGDILSSKTARSMYSEYGEKYTVKYCDDLGKFECDYQFGIERYLKIGCEVIGNIHEGATPCTSATVE